MSKRIPDTRCSPPPDQVWGTWEELLLACAVHRYGSDCWESVATEVQMRSASLKSLTALSCKRKYRDLRWRFCDTGDDASRSKETETVSDNCTIPAPLLLEQLRQLRLTELRRELQRYDLSIVSLQSTVKKLEEQRDDEILQLKKEEQRVSDLSEKPAARGTTCTANDSDRENVSVNASNSTDPHLSQDSPAVSDERKQQRAASVPETGAARRDSMGEGSADDESVAQVGIIDAEVENRGLRDAKESSESESSASHRKGEKNDKQINEDGNLLSNSIRDAASRPLFEILDSLRSHKYSIFFLRRQETQESHNYSRIIRQQMDLETVQMRLQRGFYSDCNKKFFRDLLIIFNNAIVFFKLQSPERIAALELRRVVTKVLGERMPGRSDSLDLEVRERELGNSHEIKPRVNLMMVACRKRSTIPTKVSPLFAGWDKNANTSDDKAAIHISSREESLRKAVDHRVTKKRTKEPPATAMTGEKNGKSRNKTRMKRNPDRKPKTMRPDYAESKLEKDPRRNSTIHKKYATNTHHGMRSGGAVPAGNDMLPDTSNRSKRGELLKIMNGWDDSKKPQRLRANPPKKGRPPKKVVASGKRKRAAASAEEEDSPSATKKRSRR